MKKKIKIALLALVLLPCMFVMTACTKDLTLSEYTQRVKTVAENHYNNLEKNDLVVDYSKTTKETWKQKVYWSVEQGQEHSGDYDFEKTTTVTQKIEKDFGTDASESEYQNLRVTTVTTVNEKGTKTNAAGNGVETFDTTEVTTEVATFVQTMVDGVAQMKLYKSVEVKVDGVVDEDETEKSILPYVDSELYSAKLESVMTDVDGKMVESLFMSLNQISLLGGEVEYYAEGKEDFGAKITFETLDVNNGQISYSKSNAENRFSDGRLASSTSTIHNEMGDRMFGLVEHQDCVQDITSSLTFGYDATITAPEGFADVTNVAVPTVNIQSF